MLALLGGPLAWLASPLLKVGKWILVALLVVAAIFGLERYVRGRGKLEAKVEGLASRFYDRFLGLVAENRDMDVDAVHEVAQGRVWTGAQAKDVGLVDELGGFGKALSIAKAGGKIGGENFPAFIIVDDKGNDFFAEWAH